MIDQDLNDTESPKEIRAFVENHEHILFTECIEKGYNGILYFGKRLKMDEEVAVKFYLSKEGFNASEEAVILRKIDHPNILKVDDIRFLPPWNSFFLSPKISGGDLQGLIDTEGVIPFKRALYFIHGILNGISHLHTEHGLVHRDLKPGNILYRKEDDTPIIADLGSVKKIDETIGFVGASKCTQLFLPPEAIFEAKYLFESDLYQIGIVLYQLLGGFFPLETPNDFLNQKELARLKRTTNSMKWEQERFSIINSKIGNGKLLNLNSLPTYLPKKLKRVIRKATNPDYTKRYLNASEFLTDINQLIRDYPDYYYEDDDLIIDHKNGKTYRVSQVTQSKYILKHKGPSGIWRGINKHDGTFDEVLQIASEV